MADFFLHTQLIEDLYQKNPDYTYLDWAKLGAQGPDPIYFCLRYQKDAMMLANDLHHKATNPFLIALTHYIKDAKSPELKAFYIGFISHYVLDVVIHPYIYHFTGDYYQDREETYLYRGLHLSFERGVDMDYIHYRYQMEPEKFHKKHRILKLNRTPEAIEKMMQTLIETIHHHKKGGLYYKIGHHTMHLILRYGIVDKTGLKRIILKGIDRLHPKSPLILSSYPYRRRPYLYDYLNLSHHVWKHPVTGETSKRSVLELYDEAYTKTQHMVDQLLSYIEGKIDLDLEKLFENRSFNTGMDVSISHEMVHFNPYKESKLKK
jgi:hypothetical protein